MAVASNALRPSVQQNHQYKSRLVSSTTPSALEELVESKEGFVSPNNLSNETEETSEACEAKKIGSKRLKKRLKKKRQKEQREEVSSEDA